MKFLKYLWRKLTGKSNSTEITDSSTPPVVVVPPVDPIPEIPTKEEVEQFPTKPISDELLASIVINSSSMTELKSVCNIIKVNKGEYMAVQDVTGVPWDVVAACHYRESSLDFRGVLHNGEFIIGTGRKTKLVPAGRGPFLNWKAAAIDAMLIEENKFPKVWNTAGKFDFCERYNGLGYRNKGVPSPYVYAGTNKYKSGLYVADGKYSSSKVDKRLGCAAIIKGLLA